MGPPAGRAATAAVAAAVVVAALRIDAALPEDARRWVHGALYAAILAPAVMRVRAWLADRLRSRRESKTKSFR